MGGIFFPEKYLYYASTRFYALKKKFGIPFDAEIKWSPTRDNWIYRNLKGNDRVEFYGKIINLIDIFSALVIVSVGIPYANLTEQIKKKIMFINIENLLERFNMILQSCNQVGIVIADEQSSRQDNKALLENVFEMIDEGTKFQNVKRRVPINLLTAPSIQIPFLQMADLIVGITVAMVCKNYTYAKPYWPQIKRRFYKDNKGNIEGIGLKLHPKKLEKRYSILLDELNS